MVLLEQLLQFAGIEQCQEHRRFKNVVIKE